MSALTVFHPRWRFAHALALLAMLAQLLLPFAHAAAMDAGVPLAWCGTGPQPTAMQGDGSPAQGGAGEAKILVKCALCSVASLHALAPPPALTLLALVPAPTLPVASLALSHRSPLTRAIPPPPRGPPLISY
ncbi:DUF2946 family protein [Chitinibacter tainanensis]|uniref:DUF2946 family protein n=1 Tax=Chitinibacter tainanensis TaxID=230667 RepID=UPI00041756FF|nr:DUF2946 family protein [Chitinibacter tainanensis]